MIFVDTNYFISLLVNRNNLQKKIAEKLFVEAAIGETDIFTSTIVVFEVYWVLSRFYKKQPQDAVKLIRKILELSFLRIQDKQLLSDATTASLKNKVGFYDSFNLLYAKKHKAKDFKTFDTKLHKVFLASK